VIDALAVSTPDGSNQAVHPDVVDTVDGFAGWRYWMACTPYPFGDDRLENPVVRVSRDGIAWELPEGAPDPLLDAPQDSQRHWSDTDLTLRDGRLHLVFRGCERGSRESEFLAIVSEDGRHWSAPRTVWSGTDGVSPALLADDAGWWMWHIRCSPRHPEVPAGLVVHRGRSLGAWDEQFERALDIPGHTPWHLDVQRTPDGFEALVAAYPSSTNPSRCSLFHLVSTDGLGFVLSQPGPVVRPSWRRWNNRMVYRSTFVRQADGRYRIWYSGASWGMRCGIGLAEGELRALRHHAGPPGAIGTLARWREDLAGLLSYVVQYRLPAPVRGLLRVALRRAG
jgi:hypothetical protein